MKTSRITFLLIVIVIYVLGLVLYCSGKMSILNPHTSPVLGLESMEGTKGAVDVEQAFKSCPNLLLKRGNQLLLYNTSRGLQEGINPLIFQSMEQYLSYYNTSKQNGSPCAQLYVQEEYDAQGNQVMRVRPSPFDVGGGLSNFAMVANQNNQYHINRASPIPIEDASRDNPPYNQNLYPGFDALSQYEGRYTKLDQVHDSTMNRNGGSLNPMDPNWGGIMETQRAIDAGVYEENNVSIRVP